ncbi:MAG: SIMPL domain-containing protein [Anaerolineales bacterium]
MKNRWKTTILFILTLGAVLVASVGCAPPGGQTQSEEGDRRTISVSGSGVISAAPDQVTLRLGVETTAETASEALSQNNDQMTDVINSLRDAGIPAEQIRTQTVRLNPRYETPPREPGQAEERELVGYTARNIVVARTEDLDAIGQLLDTAVRAGANRIDGLRFEVDDSQDLLNQARDAAWEDAEEKAQQLASLAGAELGDVLSIDESTRTPRPVTLESAEMERAAGVPVEPGSEEVQVNLQVTWSLR